jgi:phosphatidate cytidylyltransferase
MAGDREPRDRPEEGSDDLFEDLDKFFASIDESEWPDAEPADEGEETSAPAAETPAPVAEEPVPVEPEEPEPAAAREDTGPEDGGSDEDWELPSTDEELLPDEPPEAPLLPEVPSTPAGGGPTREMTSEDWARLRDVLGEEEEEEAFQFTDVPTELGPTDLSPEESLFGYPAKDEAEPGIELDEPAPLETGAAGGAGMEEPPEPTAEPGEGDLTLEDLKKAPPEYQRLPTEDELELTRPAPGDAGPSETETFEMPKPSLADVEAAADHLAEEFQAPPGGVDDDLLGDLGAPAPPRRTVKVGEPESLVGPAWEDPTSRTVTADTNESAPQAARNLPVAVVTGAGLAVGALIAVFIAKWLFAVVAGAVILFGQLELYTTMQRRDYQPATALGLVLGGFILAAAYAKGEAAMQFMLVVGLLLSFLWYMAAAPKARTNVIANVGATVLGLGYVPFLAGYIFVILTAGDSGRSLMLAILGLTFLNDIAAFGFGSIWGSRPLAPSVSPRKSLEGLLGGTFVTILLAIAFVPSIDGMTVVRSVGLAAVVCVFAPLGDLSESLLKRDLGVKDMGNILPGHGGVLDRIDSALFVAPASFYFLRLIF